MTVKDLCAPSTSPLRNMGIKYFVVKHFGFHLIDVLSMALIQHCTWLLSVCFYEIKKKLTNAL